jgi:hypothetical protein
MWHGQGWLTHGLHLLVTNPAPGEVSKALRLQEAKLSTRWSVETLVNYPSLLCFKLLQDDREQSLCQRLLNLPLNDPLPACPDFTGWDEEDGDQSICFIKMSTQGPRASEGPFKSCPGPVLPWSRQGWDCPASRSPGPFKTSWVWGLANNEMTTLSTVSEKHGCSGDLVLTGSSGQQRE